MKKAFRRASFITALLFAFSVLLGSMAVSASSSVDGFSSAALTYIEESRVSDHSIPENVQLDGSTILLDSDNGIAAVCFFLKPAGYVIVRSDYVIAEAAFSDTRSAQMLREHVNKSIYYGGALTYFVQDTVTENYTELFSGVQVSGTDAMAQVQLSEERQRSVVETTKNTSIRRVAPITTFLPGSPRREWHYNPDGRDAATATAITLAYFADYIDSWVVPSWHMTSNGQSLTELLTPWIYYTDDEGRPTGGGHVSDVLDGFSTYFRWRGISDRYTVSYRSEYVMNETLLEYILNKKIPVTLLIENHPNYYHHFVVCHGVLTDVNKRAVYQVVVNDGQGSNSIYINISYCTFAVIMEAAE